LRTASSTKNNLIQGNFQAIATTLGTGNGDLSTVGRPYASGTSGNLIRQSCTDAGVAQSLVNGVDVRCATAFIANPQYGSINVSSNLGHSNYHSMQAAVSMKPTRGLSFQTTYTWSRNLADSNPNDWTTGTRQYYLSGQHRSHQISSYGTFDMPMGANGFIFRNAGGALKKAVEGWTISWVGSLSSGAPLSMTGNVTTFWGDTNVNLVDPKAFNRKGGKVSWVNPGLTKPNYYYSDGNGNNLYTNAIDETMCAQLASSLQNSCRGLTGTTPTPAVPATIHFKCR